LTDAVSNIEAFYDNFDEGGWNAWFVMTQNEVNNPYGAYLAAQAELDSRLASAIGLEVQELSWTQGFQSIKTCAVWEDRVVIGADGNAQTVPNPADPNGPPIPQTERGKCLVPGQTVTPGSIIHSQLDKALGSGIAKLISAQSIDQLISAFAAGLLNKYVFNSSRGLFASDTGRSTSSSGNTGTSNTSRLGVVDIDGDGIPDGYDADRDGLLQSNTDLCYHGGNPTAGCILSSTAPNSPYFAPVCRAVNASVIALGDFGVFINTNANQIRPDGENFIVKADSELWARRAGEVNSSVEEVLSVIQNYRAPQFDGIEIGTNRFANYIGRVLESLGGDGNDLDLAKIGNGGGGINNLKRYVADNVSFFQDIQRRFGNCSRPNIQTVSGVVVPPEPIPDVTQEDLTENNICATPDEVRQFLINNPGDEHRIAEAFPCTAGELQSMGICATPDEVRQFLINNPGDEHRLDEAFSCIQ
jgi:hypothetical protein